MNNLIPDHYSRCNNHRCHKRNTCKRYRQLAVDFEEAHNHVQAPMVSQRVMATKPVARYSEVNCQNYIP